MLLALGMMGCQAIGTSSTSAAQLRIIHATPEIGGVDVYAGNAALAYNVGFGTVTSYVRVAPAVYLLGANQANTRQILSGVRQTLAEGQQYTLLVSNPASDLQTAVLLDQKEATPAGQSSLRIIDEAARVGPLDLYLVPRGENLRQAIALQQGVAADTNTGYLKVPSGSYALVAVASGRTLTATTVPIYTGSFTSYPSGSARTAVLLEGRLSSGTAVQVITATDCDGPGATQ